MNAIRYILNVKNNKITINLPDDFDSDKAEVIILPYQEDEIENDLKKYIEEITITYEYKNINETFIDYINRVKNEKIQEEEENKKIIYIYRGHSDKDWKLETSFERAIVKYPISNNENYFTIEKKIIREFKRKAHNLVPKTPEDQNNFEWLSLMRHYLAPSRLLDFNYSFYIALFFAIEHMQYNNKNKQSCAIYAINNKLFDKAEIFNEIITKKNIRHIKKLDFDNKIHRYSKINKYRDFFMENITEASITSDNIISKFIFPPKEKYDNIVKPIVFNISPYNLNERITIQQGTFLCPWDIKKTFRENLINTLKIMDKKKEKKYIYKIIIELTKDERKGIIHELHRMNINSTTLYPGIEGFAKSLGTKMEVASHK